MNKKFIFSSIIFLIFLVIIFSYNYFLNNAQKNIENIKNNTFIIYKDSEIIKNSLNPKGIFEENNNPEKIIGTGFFINKNTFITAGHNVDNNISNYKISKNNNYYYELKLDYIDIKNDIAYLKFNNFVDYKKIYFSKNINKNNIIYSIGFNPEKNILETKSGNILEIKNNKIYSDIEFIKGNSGGPLINNSGKIIGINLNYDLANKTGISYILDK